MSELGLPFESDQGPCGDSDIDVEDLLSSASKRKFQGSATYSTKFDSRWTEQYPCIQAVKGDPYSFLCHAMNLNLLLLCLKNQKKLLGSITRNIENDTYSQSTYILAMISFFKNFF